MGKGSKKSLQHIPLDVVHTNLLSSGVRILSSPDPALKALDLTAGHRFYASIGSPRFVVAPMVNQSELPFRLLCRRYASQLTYTPMIHSSLFVTAPKYNQEHFDFERTQLNDHQAVENIHSSPPSTSTPSFLPPCTSLSEQEERSLDRPLIVQFCGDDPLTLMAAARMVESHCEAIDLNLGCPQGIARRGHYGAFLLKEVDLLRRIVSTLYTYISVPITCKIRVLETREATIALALVLQESGCAMLTVHGRTREHIKDKIGACDWEMIRHVKQAVRIPVIANGGIGSLNDALRCLEFTGCDGVMSGEAILENPALFDARYQTRLLPALAITREYLELCAKHRHNNSVIRPHLFKFLFRLLTLHTDLRERFGKCSNDEIPVLLSELENREAAMTEEEREKKYRTVTSWYSRHLSVHRKHPLLAQSIAKATISTNSPQKSAMSNDNVLIEESGESSNKRAKFSENNMPVILSHW